MEKCSFLSIDVGSSSCKTVLMDAKGYVLGRASVEYPSQYGQNDAVQQDSEDWWNAVIETVRQIFRNSALSTEQIAAIAIDTQSSVMLPLDRAGEPLHPAITCSDKRAKAQVAWIREAIGQETLSAINGNHNDASNIAPKMMWFRDTYPELYAKTWKFVNASGYLVHRLTGVFSWNISEGGMTQIFDIEKGDWSEELVLGCGLDRSKLPTIYECSEIVGHTTTQAASLLEVPAGIPVLAGAMDVCACALGCGITAPKNAFITGGTVTALGSCSDKPIKDDTLHVYHHIIPNLWCNVAGVDFGGGSFRWYRDKFFSHVPKERVYDEMNVLARQARAGSDGLLFLPSLTGQRCPQWDANMRGVFFGITPRHGQPEFLRAVMEGNAYGVRHILDILEKNDAPVEKCVIAGGVSKSDLWVQIFASVLEKSLYRVRCLEDAALGNMISAANAVGLFSDFQVNLPSREWEPCQARQEDILVYRTMCGIYNEMEKSFQPLFQKLVDVNIGGTCDDI